jgi:hypothetical protein
MNCKEHRLYCCVLHCESSQANEDSFGPTSDKPRAAMECAHTRLLALQVPCRETRTVIFNDRVMMKRRSN